jgi:hypothetical protein
MTGGTSTAASTGGIWDSSVWDGASWGGTEVVTSWTSPGEHPGYSAAGKIQVATNTLSVQWMAHDFIWEYGGPLG